MNMRRTRHLTPMPSGLRDTGPREPVTRRLLTVPEAARELGIDRTTLNHWIADGRIAAIRLGRTWRVRTSTLDIWLDQQEAASLARAEREREARHG